MSDFAIRAGQEPLIAPGIQLPLELPNTPVFCLRLLEVVEARLLVFLPHYQAVMTPAQFATQCVVNCLLIRVGEIELPKIAKIGDRKAFAELVGEVMRQFFE